MNNPEFASESRIMARRALDQAASELERALFNMGFKAGWEAAVRRLTDVVPEALPETPKLASVPNGDSPARKIVSEFIRNNPGQRGNEIVRAIREGVGIKGHTIRTAIYRLKEADEIKNDDGRWFPNGNANGYHSLDAEEGG